MVGLPHDSPAALESTLEYLKHVPCGYFDMRILRIYPGTRLYRQMLATGDVTKNWWLETAAADTFNKTLPSSLGVHFRHKRFQPMQLQHLSLRFINELSGNGPRTIARILRVGCRGRALGFAGLVLQARQRSARQARMLLRHLEQAMAANAENASAMGQTDKVWTPAVDAGLRELN
jgi:hypothetical protein